MRAWIVKYALTQGIFEVEGEEDDGLFMQRGSLGHLVNCYYGENKAWCRTKEKAIEIAEKKRKRKIEFLTKQIEKLETMKFDD